MIFTSVDAGKASARGVWVAPPAPVPTAYSTATAGDTPTTTNHWTLAGITPTVGFVFVNLTDKKMWVFTEPDDGLTAPGWQEVVSSAAGVWEKIAHYDTPQANGYIWDIVIDPKYKRVEIPFSFFNSGLTMEFTGNNLAEFRGTQISSEGGAPSAYSITPTQSAFKTFAPNNWLSGVLTIDKAFMRLNFSLRNSNEVITVDAISRSDMPTRVRFRNNNSNGAMSLSALGLV